MCLGWNLFLINMFIDGISSIFIGRFRTTNELLNNKVIWVLNKSGYFIVKSLYWIIVKEFGDVSNLNNCKLLSKLHERHKVFLWKIASNALVIRLNL